MHTTTFFFVGSVLTRKWDQRSIDWRASNRCPDAPDRHRRAGTCPAWPCSRGQWDGSCRRARAEQSCGAPCYCRNLATLRSISRDQGTPKSLSSAVGRTQRCATCAPDSWPCARNQHRHQSSFQLKRRRILSKLHVIEIFHSLLFLDITHMPTYKDHF